MNINQMMKQAQQIHKTFKKNQKKLEDLKITTESGGGDIKVSINGKGQILNIHINETLLKKENKEIIEDLIIVAINNAKKISEDKMNELMNTENPVFDELKIPV